MTRRTALAVTVFTAIAILAAAWGPARQYIAPLLGIGPAGDRVDMCGMEHPTNVSVSHIDVYNFYGSSDHADHHQVAAADIEWVCTDHLTFLATGDTVPLADLEDVPVTVFVLTWSDSHAPRNPFYVYWLKNKRGVAVKDLSRTYFVPTSGLVQYYSPTAESIPRYSVPPP
ncbi:MAG: hypothetical protein Q4G35_02345 [Propionibacteriaceae bacterium]|nr:hypothetical protein [Propionibacteriaceae bacterium]